MSISIERHLWNVDEYDRLVELGFFAEDDRVELIRGEIVTMSPVGDKHSGRVNALNELLHDKLGKTVTLAIQNPIRLNNQSEPLPDVSVLRRRADFYATQKPTPQDIYLLIEISDSTLEYDEQVKIPMYAESQIPEVWIVDLKFGLVSQFSEPFAGKYRQIKRARRGESLTCTTLANLTCTAAEILGED